MNMSPSPPKPTGRARSAARAGRTSKGLRNAIREEAANLTAIADPAKRVRAVGDVFAALDAELAKLAEVRYEAVRDLRAQGLSYDKLALASGLSKSRVAHLVRTVARDQRPRPGKARR